MRVELIEVTIRDIVCGYIDNEQEGVFGFE